MPSITTWTRLEPRSRHQDMSAFLQARLGDPLWQLAMQWRIGEFVGQDAAFPVTAELQVTSRPVLAGTDDPQLPLDAVLAAEPSPALEPGQALRLGTELALLLADHGASTAALDALVAAYPYQPDAAAPADPQGRSYLSLVGNRLPDGTALLPVLRQAVAGGSLPAQLAEVPRADVAAVLAAAADWLAGQDGQLPAASPPDRWQPATLAYRGSLPVAGSSGPFAEARIEHWAGDELDWFSFDLAAPSGTTSPGSPTPTTSSYSGVPHPLSFPGSPDARYWAMEDGGVNFAAVPAGPSDLARMLVIEFATVTSPDWYLQPVRLPVGALHTVSLSVRNTFGELTQIPMLAGSLTAPGGAAGGEPDWILFRPTVADGTGVLNGLLLPSLTADQLRSGPIESVALVRDDSYQRGWALETAVAAADGRVLDRRAAELPPPAPRPPVDDGSQLRYLLQTPVPAWAFPLVPTEDPAPLVQLALPDPDVPPRGVLLTALTGQPVQQQLVPPWQATLTRQRRFARGPAGQLLSWTARGYRFGGSAASVALDFDQAVAED
jgi:hypothetical protein